MEKKKPRQQASYLFAEQIDKNGSTHTAAETCAQSSDVWEHTAEKRNT